MKPVSLALPIFIMGLLAGCGPDKAGPGGRLPDDPLVNPKETAILRADLNGDQRITTEEYDTYLTQFFARYDANQDGYLDEDEWETAQDENGPYGIARAGFLAVDLSGDERISLRELLSLPRFAFLEIDTDGNGMITPKELEKLPAMKRDRERRTGPRRSKPEDGRSGDPGLPY